MFIKHMFILRRRMGQLSKYIRFLLSLFYSFSPILRHLQVILKIYQNTMGIHLILPKTAFLCTFLSEYC